MWAAHISRVNTLENISVPERKQVQYDRDLDYLGGRIALACVIECPTLAPFLDMQ